MPWQKTDRKSIWVYIKLEGNSFANDVEFDLRYELEDEVEKRGLGRWQGGGSGGGWMDFSFEVKEPQRIDEIVDAVKALLEEYQVPRDEWHVAVVDMDEQICDDLPNFQPGDCLCFQFDDGDYGAILILACGNEIDNRAEQTLVAVLDYKQTQLPEIDFFEQRKWLLSNATWAKGQPYRVWLHCYGGIQIVPIGKILLVENDIKPCLFQLSWEILGEQLMSTNYGKARGQLN